MLNLNDLRKSEKKELLKKFNELDKEIAQETFSIEARRSNKTAQLRAMKKDRARIATVLTELELLPTTTSNE